MGNWSLRSNWWVPTRFDDELGVHCQHYIDDVGNNANLRDLIAAKDHDISRSGIDKLSHKYSAYSLWRENSALQKFSSTIAQKLCRFLSTTAAGMPVNVKEIWTFLHSISWVPDFITYCDMTSHCTLKQAPLLISSWYQQGLYPQSS